MRAALSLAFGLTLSAGRAFAQTSSITSPPTTTSTTITTRTPASTSPSAFASLSPGNQKIAQALYDAQVVKGSMPSTASSATAPSASPSRTASRGSTTGPSKLTLDQIATMKQSGRGWGEIFKQMKAQGLVHEKSLWHVISSARRSSKTTAPDTGSGYTSTGPVVSPASGRTHVETQKGGNSEGAAARGNSPKDQ